MGFFSKIKEGLKKTRNSIAQSVTGIINSFTKIHWNDDGKIKIHFVYWKWILK